MGSGFVELRRDVVAGPEDGGQPSSLKLRRAKEGGVFLCLLVLLVANSMLCLSCFLSKKLDICSTQRRFYF